MPRVPHESHAFHALMPQVPRPLNALMHHVTRVLHALVLYVPPALLTFWFTFLVSYMPRAKHTIVFHVSYVLLHLTCFLLWVFSGCLCLELYLLLCSSSLTCFRCFNLNMLCCISCFVAFMICAFCTFFPLAIWVFEKKNENFLQVFFGLT